MFKKWRPSKQLIGAMVALILVVIIAFSFGYVSEMLAPQLAPSPAQKQAQKQYDAPKATLDFQTKEDAHEELKVTFSEERKQQNFNNQTPIAFEKKVVDSKENERNFFGILISGLLIGTLIIGVGIVMYIQWRNAKRNSEIGGM